MKVKALKTSIIIAIISLTTSVFAQMSGDASKGAPVKKEELPEAVRTEIKNFHEKVKAINIECRKKRHELKENLSIEAKRAVQEHKDRVKKEHLDKKQEQDQKNIKDQSAPNKS